jgi:spermidine synthase
MMTENKRNWQILVLCTYFSLGAFALISQTMMLREFFVVVYGNELVFGVLLTNWLVGIFTGALIGGAAAEKSRDNLMLFVMSILVMCVLLPVSITLTRLLYTISGTPAGTYIGFFKVFFYSALFIIPVSFFIGFVFPIAAKVQSQHRAHNLNNGISKGGWHPQPKDGVLEGVKTGRVKGISNIYIFEAFGSLLSGVVYTFFLVGRCSAYLVALLIILPLLICCGLILLKSRRYKAFSIVCVLLIFNLVSFLPSMSGKFDAVTVEKRWQSISTLPLVYTTDSKYQNIAMSSLFDQYNLYSNSMLAAVFPNDEDNMLLAAHLVCQHPGPKRILIIGDAVSGLAKALLRFDVKEVVSVEIDAKTIDTILKFLPPEDKHILNDKRFKIVIADGRKYVKDLIRSHGKPGNSLSPPQVFDVVYVNVSEPSTLLLNRYYTKEFFLDLSRVLNERGVIALKITSSENYEKGIVSDYTASVYQTVRSVFPEVVVAPGYQNFIFASKQGASVSDNPELLAQRYTTAGVKPEKLGFIFYSFYPEEKTRFIKKALQTSGKFKINTDETPIATVYFNKIIGWYAASNLSGILGFIETIKLKDVTIIILLLFLARMFYLWRAKRKQSFHRRRSLKFHTLLAVFSSGMAGLSLELVILYTFQNNFGNVYHIIGFIIAIFMFGLPLGAVTANALLTRGKFARQRQVIAFIILVQVALAVISFLLPQMTKLFAAVIIIHQVIIFVETVLIGFAVGLVFPLSIHLYLGKQEKTGKTAGVVDAFDHMGAAVGAFFIGTLFLPVMSVANVCCLVALVPLISAIFLFTDRI